MFQWLKTLWTKFIAWIKSWAIFQKKAPQAGTRDNMMREAGMAGPSTGSRENDSVDVAPAPADDAGNSTEHDPQGGASDHDDSDNIQLHEPGDIAEEVQTDNGSAYGFVYNLASGMWRDTLLNPDYPATAVATEGEQLPLSAAAMVDGMAAVINWESANTAVLEEGEWVYDAHTNRFDVVTRIRDKDTELSCQPPATSSL